MIICIYLTSASTNIFDTSSYEKSFTQRMQSTTWKLLQVATMQHAKMWVHIHS